MDILVIVMGVIAVAVGVVGFLSEHGGIGKKEDDTADKVEQ